GGFGFWRRRYSSNGLLSDSVSITDDVGATAAEDAMDPVASAVEEEAQGTTK
ncbi:unnamed protein product, partial [Brassica oleracea var. botrytis]